MAKKSVIARQIKREKMVNRYQVKYSNLKTKIAKAKTFEERQQAIRALDRIPKNALPVRLRKRCQITGRPRGNVGIGSNIVICRNIFREWASEGKIPGIHKASW